MSSITKSTVESKAMEDNPVIMTRENQVIAMKKQIMEIAFSPLKGLFTTAFMLWMSGSSIQIFSIMVTGMALINPIKAIISTNSTFTVFEKEKEIDLKLAKLMFISFQILSLLVGVYKTYTMGLLPVTSGDWTSFIPPKTYAETSSIPL